MDNYISIKGKKIKISDETADSNGIFHLNPINPPFFPDWLKEHKGEKIRDPKITEFDYLKTPGVKL